MAFTPLYGDDGKYRLLAAANSTTLTKGNPVIDNGSGYITNADTAGGVDIRYVAVETVTTTSAGQQVLCVATDGVTFLADCDAAWAQTDVGTEADLATIGYLDPNASTDDIFYIEKGVGVAGTGTQVIGHFTRGVMNA